MYQQQNYGYQPQYQSMGYMRAPTSYTALPPTQTYAGMPAQILKGRPVASLDEVRAQTIDFDGSIFFFPNLGGNVIYTKQINPDGTANLNAYSLVEQPPVTNPSTPIPVPEVPSLENFVTKEEFEAAINDLLSKIPQAPVIAPTVSPEDTRVINSAVSKF